MKDNKKDIIRQFSLLAVTFCMIVLSALAWFVFNTKNTGTMPNLNAKNLESIEVKLYKRTLNADGTLKSEVDCNDIIISDYVPGETHYYRLEMTNGEAEPKPCAITFSNVNADFTSENPGIKADIKLADVIKLCDVYLESNSDTAIIDERIKKIEGQKNRGETLSKLYFNTEKPENRDVSVASNVIVNGNSTENLYFSFMLMQSEADNTYQYTAIKIDKVQVAS